MCLLWSLHFVSSSPSFHFALLNFTSLSPHGCRSPPPVPCLPLFHLFFTLTPIAFCTLLLLPFLALYNVLHKGSPSFYPLSLVKISHSSTPSEWSSPRYRTTHAASESLIATAPFSSPWSLRKRKHAYQRFPSAAPCSSYRLVQLADDSASSFAEASFQGLCQ